jgi:hypothetical protein
MLVMSGVKLAPKAPQEPPKPPVNVRILDPQKLRLKFVKKILPKAEAIARAKEAREELAGSSLMRAGFAETKAARALLVQRLDNRDRYYYIVTFTAGGRDTARVIVDAHDGHYSEVSTIRKKGQFLRRHPAARVGRERLEATGKSPTPAARYQLRAGVVGVHPVPVWKPCGQSLSPFLPFWQYSVGDSFVYYRFDGRRFDELTEGPA